jgi:signal transduction histidine kinase
MPTTISLLATSSTPVSPDVQSRIAYLMRNHQQKIASRTDHLFAGLLLFEWLAGIALAAWRSPRTWDGAVSHLHPHLFAAVFLGAALISLPIYLAFAFPARPLTRHTIAVAQMLSSALLIHFGDGQLEMHFHIFGSLAVLAFYRDWRVLVTASLVVATDHFLRGIYLPESIYGVLTASTWRTLEHVGWVIFEDLFLIASCIQGVREIHHIAERQALLEESHRTVEEKVRQRTTELQDAQQRLIKSAREAGMAEIATSVLHNVGNVLNSLNVSVSVVSGKVHQSPITDLTKAVAMIDDHKADLGEFLTADQRGKHLPAFLTTVTQVMAEEQAALLEEMKSLSRNVDHIKQIINVQQAYAKLQGGSDVMTDVRIADALQDALKVSLASGDNSPIEIIQQLEDLTFTVDKHALLQILINLIRNAKHAVMANPPGQRTITLKAAAVSRENEPFIAIHVIDNGIGIEPANLPRIFNHGFTTKKDGHGFGLHASANSAREMHGSLTVSSPGPHQGATFILELPLNPKQVSV